MTSDPVCNEEAALEIATAKVVREWVELELLLGFWLTQLLQVDSFRARIVWASLPNMRSRLELLSRLADTYLDEPLLADVQRVMKRIRRLGGKRNLLAHCQGWIDPETRKVCFSKEQPTDDLGYDFLGQETFDLTNVQNWPNDIMRLRADMMATWKRIRAATHTSPKMHRVQRPDQSPRSGPARQARSTPSMPQPPHLSLQGSLRLGLHWGPALTAVRP